jgi:hypothetical protein
MGGGEVSDPPVEVEAELMRENVLGGAQPVLLAAFLEQGEVELVGLGSRCPSRTATASSRVKQSSSIDQSAKCSALISMRAVRKSSTVPLNPNSFRLSAILGRMGWFLWCKDVTQL